MKVTFINEHIDHRFIRVVQVPAMSPTLATVYLDEYLGKPFERLASRDEDRHFSEPCHIAPRLVELATPSAGSKELIR